MKNSNVTTTTPVLVLLDHASNKNRDFLFVFNVTRRKSEYWPFIASKGPVLWEGYFMGPIKAKGAIVWVLLSFSGCITSFVNQKKCCFEWSEAIPGLFRDNS